MSPRARARSAKLFTVAAVVIAAFQASGVVTTAVEPHLIPSNIRGGDYSNSDADYDTAELTGTLNCPEEAPDLIRPQAISLSYGFDPKLRVSKPEDAFASFVNTYWPAAPPRFSLTARATSAARFDFENRRAFVLVTRNDVRNWAVTTFNACLKESEAWRHR